MVAVCPPLQPHLVWLGAPGGPVGSRRGRPAAGRFCHPDPGVAAALEDAWVAWHKALTATRPDEPAERRAAAAFAELAWRPLREALPADLRTVSLAAEGKLSQVPWGPCPGRNVIHRPAGRVSSGPVPSVCLLKSSRLSCSTMPNAALLAWSRSSM